MNILKNVIEFLNDIIIFISNLISSINFNYLIILVLFSVIASLILSFIEQSNKR